MPEHREIIDDHPFYVIDTFIPVYDGDLELTSKNNRHLNEKEALARSKSEMKIDKSGPNSNKKFLMMDTYWVDIKETNNITYETQSNKEVYSNLQICPY